MWNRQTLKELGKKAFKNNYWMSVAAAIALGIAIAGITTTCSVSTGQNVGEMSHEASVSFSIVAGTSSFLIMLLNAFVLKPLEIGGRQFFLNNSEGRADIHDLLQGFKVNYLNNVLTIPVYSCRESGDERHRSNQAFERDDERSQMERICP